MRAYRMVVIGFALACSLSGLAQTPKKVAFEAKVPDPEPPGMVPFTDRGMEFKVPEGWKPVAADPEILGKVKCRAGIASFEKLNVGVISIWCAPKLSNDPSFKDVERLARELAPEGNDVKEIELKTKTKGEHPYIWRYQGSQVKQGVRQGTFLFYGYKEPAMLKVTQCTYKIFARVDDPQKVEEVERDALALAATLVHRPTAEVDAATAAYIQEVVSKALQK